MSKKTTVVLLPGLNGTDGLFQSLIDATPKEFNVIAISYPTHEKRSYSELKVLVESEISSIESPYILVGESFSGPLSLMIGQNKPSGLIGIILVATFITAPNLTVGRFLPWRIGFTLTKPLYSLRLLLSSEENSGFIKAIATEMQKVAPTVLADRIQSIFAVNAKLALIACDVPIVYFRGTKDFVVPVWNLKSIVKTKPEVSRVEFDTGHFLLQSKPVQVWREIAAFASRVVP